MVLVGLWFGHGPILGSFFSGPVEEMDTAHIELKTVRYHPFQSEWLATGLELKSSDSEDKNLLTVGTLRLKPGKKSDDENSTYYKYEYIDARAVQLYANKETLNLLSILKKRADELEKSGQIDPNFSFKRATIQFDGVFLGLPIPGFGERKLELKNKIFQLENVSSREDLIVRLIEKVIDEAGLPTSQFFSNL